MLEHGGRLLAAAALHDIPLADWLDLSNGINPQGWPVPALPASVWQRLPEDGDGLEVAAAAFYGNAGVLPGGGIAGGDPVVARAAATCSRRLPSGPLYSEHPFAWQRAGHRSCCCHAALPRALAAATPYVLLCNPNNPTAACQPRAALLAAAQQLNQRGGWLIVERGVYRRDARRNA